MIGLVAIAAFLGVFLVSLAVLLLWGRAFNIGYAAAQEDLTREMRRRVKALDVGDRLSYVDTQREMARRRLQ